MSQPGRRGKSGNPDAAAAGLTGGGPSQVGVDGAMRARDVSRPRPIDVEAAEKIVQVSRRPARPGGQPSGSGGSSPVSS